MSAMRSFRRGRGRRLSFTGATAIAAFALMLGVTGAFADPNPGQFQLQGDTTQTAGQPGDDWNNVFAGTAGDFSHTFILGDTEAPANDTTAWKQGTAVDQPIDQWAWQTNTSVIDAKADITDAYAAAYKGASDNTIMYFGLDRFDNNGDASVGFWFLQDPNFSLNADGTFSGQHVDGDIFIKSQFLNGGGISNPVAYEWQNGSLQPIVTGALCDSTTQTLCAIDNQNNAVDAPWPYTAKGGSGQTQIPTNAFFEGGFDLSSQFNTNDLPCFSHFIALTATSQGNSETLKDLAAGNVQSCGTIELKKHWVGTAGTTQLNVGTTAGAHDVAGPTTVSGQDGTTGATEVHAGTYFLSEDLTNPSDYSTSISCFNDLNQNGTQDNGEPSVSTTAASPGWSVPLGIGDHVVCTITNTALTPSLTITKVADQSEVNEGDGIGYTITITNNGNGTAHGVKLSDTLPTNTGTWSFDNPSAGWGGTCTISSGTLSCGGQNGVDLAPTDSLSVHISSTTDSDSCGTVANSADASSSNGNSPSVGPVDITVDCPDLSITKTADHNSPVTAGDQIGFTVEVKNTGTGYATGVTLNDTLPTGSGSGVTWSIDQTTGDPASFELGSDGSGHQTLMLAGQPITLAAGADLTVHIVALTSDTECTVYDNSATLTATNTAGAGPATAEESCSPAHVSITKTADHSSPVNAGDQIGFTVEVRNTGTGDATGVTLDDPLPAGSGSGVTWSVDNSVGTPGQFVLGGSPGSQTLSLASTTLPAGADYKIHVTANTSATECGTYDNTATLTTANANDPDPASAEEACAPAEIHIVKTADAATVNVGSSIGFTMTVYNAGSGDAHGVTLTDQLPTNAGLSWSIASQGAGWGGSCGIAAGVLSCGPATVPGGTTKAASTFTVHIVSGTTAATGGDCPSSGVVDNTGSVTTSNDGSDRSSASTCVQALVDLSITKSGSPASQTLGNGNITWTMVVKNNGPDADTGVTIADPMPAGNTFVSATTTKGSCTGGAILHCTIGTMAAGESVTITLVTTPSTVGTQTNTATVAGARPETNTGNNTASASVAVEAPPFTPPPAPVYCVAVSKVAPKQLFVGRKTKLTIRVTKHGRAVKGVHVRIKGPKFNMRTKASNKKGVITARVKMKKAGIVVFSPIASKRCNTKRVGVTGVFTPPVTG